ncbi:MAG: tRNA glutamyl-Q(34) synthetase GluQRS [Candidatus Macondimonas sp.]
MAAVPCGRFAPSPTGPLHFGSLVTALASFLDCRHVNGRWQVRIEDLDQARVIPGVAEIHLRTLERFGLSWDGPVVHQSQRIAYYDAALQQLQAAGTLYPCICSRAEIVRAGRMGVEGPIYPGTCRNKRYPFTGPHALRVRTESAPILWHDAIQGPQCHDLATLCGDFVLRRADGVVAYQLAVVVDDAAQGVNRVMRGADLIASTPRQIHLQRLLGLPTPRYAHVPLALDGRGEKLAKRLGAAAVATGDPAPVLCQALAFLGQAVPPNGPRLMVKELIDCAIAHWEPARIPQGSGWPAPPLPEPFGPSRA